jgi:TetR/AcrR family transcriptional regulator, cholesterol catabolism regulator
VASTGKRGTRKKAAPKRVERRNRQVEVVNAAIRIFWEKGYSAASVQDVADAVGVLKGSLYYYINSKEDLLVEIFAESHHQASEIIAEAKELDVEPLARLHFYFQRYVRWYLENVERVSLYFRDWRYLTGDARARVVKERAAYDRFVRSEVSAARKAGTLPDALDLKFSVFFVLGAVHSVADWYRRTGPGDPDVIARTFADMALASLGATPA